MRGVKAWAKFEGGIVVAACVFLAAAANAQPASGPLKFESHPADTSYRTLMQGSGFWVNDTGDLVTARHVVDGCSLVVISGQGLTQTAKVVALSDTDDVALIHAPHTSTLAIVFSEDVTDDVGLPVLAASFEALKTLKSSGIFSNGMLQAQDMAGGTLRLTLQAEQGASGAPVLDRKGLVQGMLIRRTQTQYAMLGSVPTGGIGYVQAVSRDRIRAFLRAQGVMFSASDQSQLSPSQNLAARAASLTQGVFCWK